MPQLNLFGQVIKNKPDFIGEPSNDYQRFVNIKWQSYRGSRKDFVPVVASDWNQFYKGKEEKIKDFLKKHEKPCNEESTAAAKTPFVIKIDKTAEKVHNESPILIANDEPTTFADDAVNEGVKIDQTEAHKNNAPPNAIINTKRFEIIKQGLNACGISIDKIDSNLKDLESEQDFMEELENVFVLLKKFKSLEDTWKSQKFHRKGTLVGAAINKVNLFLESFPVDLKELLTFSINKQKLEMKVESEILKNVYRSSLIKKIFLDILAGKPLLVDATSRLRNINNKRFLQSKNVHEERNTKFVSSCQDSWDESFTKLGAAEPTNPLSKMQLEDIGREMMETNFIRVIDALKCAGVDMPQFPSNKWLNERALCITNHLPVIHVSNPKTKRNILVNIHELTFSFGHDTFMALLLLSTPEEGESSTFVEDSIMENDEAGCDDDECMDTDEVVHIVNAKPGRKPLYQKHPNLCGIVLDFLEQHGYNAQAKRRSDVGTVGCTLEEILNHCKDKIPNFKASKETIRRLMYPPREGTIMAKRFHKKIPARVPPNKNNERKANKDGHFLMSKAKHIREFGAKYAPETSQYSLDNMNKVIISSNAMAVSRFHQPRGFMPINDATNHPDHDFPGPKGYKLEVSGIMKLDRFCQRGGQRSRSWDNGDRERWTRSNSLPSRIHPESQRLSRSNNPIEKDHLGRQHYKRPVTGQAHVRIRTDKHHNVNATTHVNDIKPLLDEDVKNGKSIALLGVDGGPDLSVRNTPNIMEFGRLWQETNLGALCCFDYGANLSYRNEIERVWSPITKTLSGVRFHDRLDGEDKPPAFQTGLTEEERKIKEEIIFNKAMSECETLVKKAKYGGKNIEASYVKCFSSEETDSVQEYESVYNFCDGPLYTVNDPSNKNLKLRYKFLCKHLVRQTNSIWFVACLDKQCTHCTKLTIGRGVKNLQKLGGRLFDPIKSERNPGHFLSFMETEEKHRQTLQNMKNPDEDLPSRDKDLGMCTFSGCKGFTFLTKTDRDRHYKLGHGGKRGMNATANDEKVSGLNTKCQVCGTKFTTQYRLKQHKKDTGHAAKKGRKNK